jgi:DNA mismatch endonuclease (patch repair protein)
MSGTPAERLLRATLWSFGVRFRTQEAVLDASPSIVVTDCKVAVFVDDCLISRCPWHHPLKKMPKLWKTLNDRDARLRHDGWTVIRVWQHEVESTPRMIAARITMAIKTARKQVNVA